MDNLIVKHIAGSRAYGTNTPESDTDIRGIFCAPRINTTPWFPYREQNVPEEEDTKYYELATYLKLYTEGNPNIIESLWVDPNDILEGELNFSYWLLRNSAEALLSKKVAFTFSGYAVSQLRRIKGHNKWINNPQPVEAPKHKDFVKLIQSFDDLVLMPSQFSFEHLTKPFNGLTFKLVHYSGDTYGIVHAYSGAELWTKDGDFNVSAKQQPVDDRSRLKPMYIVKYCAEEYRQAYDRWRQYWQWKNGRNEVRAKLEEESGYDTKHAMHLVRLLRMGEEILKGHGVIVKRPDAKELLEIRNGAWPYDDLVKWAEEKDKYIREELYNTSRLPHSPDVRLAAKLLIEIQDIYWRK